MSETTAPTIRVETVYTADGWTTTVTLEDGRQFTRTMRRAYARSRFRTGIFKGDRKGDFEDDGVPGEVADAIENGEHMDTVAYLAER